MRRVALVLLGMVLLIPLAASANFGFGLTPNSVNGGINKPGTSFYESFYVFSSSEETLNVDVSVEGSDINDFRAVRGGKASNFSDQECNSCVEILRGEGTIDERDSAIGSGGRKTYKWSQVEFVVELPEDIEPGYHMVELVPRPSREGGQGSVSVVSTSSVPVTFRVPGKAIREGEILGMSSKKDKSGGQVITASFYNRGTVTIETDVRFEIIGKDGEKITRTAGTQRVPPEETEEFPVMVDSSEVGDEFEVRVVADYSTGKDEKQRRVDKKTEVKSSQIQKTQEEGLNPYMVVIILLVISTGITIGVIRYVNR